MQLPNNFLLQRREYKIIRFIGNGGFGFTYEAEHTMLGRRVAIKEFFVKNFCNRDAATSYVTVGTIEKKELVDKLRGKFVEEARATSRMHHPNIIKVYDVFEENGTAYYVMDYIDGPSLENVVKTGGPLSERLALSYIRQIADALAYVHSQNRLHLDVKPANIMTDGRGNAILVDFGASKQYDEAVGENTSTLMGKTSGYAPIEQMGNDVVKFTPATDIYALGATLYKLLTGVTPLDSTVLASGEELPPLDRSIGQNVTNATYAAMQTAKGRRPQSISEFLSLLDLTEVRTIGKTRNEVVDESTILSTQPTTGRASVNSNSEIPKPTFRNEMPNQNNGHEYVDLGLSVKWATCNLGADSPSDRGDYYAWGETSTKYEYTTDNSLTYKKGAYADVAGNAQYDAARANWGGTWRLPTAREMGELVNNCKWKWTRINGHKGYKVIGTNGNSIFLPATGWRWKTATYLSNTEGFYWSSSPGGGGTDVAYTLDFIKNDFSVRSARRRVGQAIRPVTD